MTRRKRTKKTKQRSNNTQKTKDRAKRTPLKTGGDLKCSGRVASSCSTSDIRRVTLVKKPANINKRNNQLSPQIIERKKEIQVLL
jgi:hypothetical protein